jgi:hypothetical protein
MFRHNERMKNKNNVTAKQLVDAILSQQEYLGNKDYAYSYATGVLQALLDEVIQIDRTPKKFRYRTIQEAVNSFYETANEGVPAGV